MAKNEPMERATMQTPDQGVRVQRFDTHFLLNGIWYITAVCPTCGLVDEEVPWAEAKTPHHAGVIADRRHLGCAVINDAHEAYLNGLQEIEAAKALRDNQRRNLQAARERAAVAEMVAKADPSPLRQREYDHALVNLKRHEHAMLEAERRIADTTRDNEH